MRLAIDLFGAPPSSGGMHLYGTEITRAWVRRFPQDELVVFGQHWVKSEFADVPEVSALSGQSGTAGRIYHQLLENGVRARLANSDWLISASPIASICFPADRRSVTIHDWRHLTNPREFSGLQKTYRRLWRRSINTARVTFAISTKTARETEAVASPNRLEIVRNGGDQALRWNRWPNPYPPNCKSIVTFGHWNNKRPDAVIEAISQVGRDSVHLVVLGATGRYREQLRSIARNCGVEGLVEFPGFVQTDEYQAYLEHADIVVMNSSDEGYGLPIDEARCFGAIPIVASDSGLEEIHGSGAVVVSDPDSTSLASAITRCLFSDGRLSYGSPEWTWSDTVGRMREVILQSL